MESARSTSIGARKNYRIWRKKEKLEADKSTKVATMGNRDREVGEGNVKIKKLKKMNLVKFQVDSISRKILKTARIRESESRGSGIAGIRQWVV